MKLVNSILWALIAINLLIFLVFFNIAGYKTARMDCRDVEHINSAFFPDTDPNPSTGAK